MNKEKRNLSQPKERHKILNIKEEENNIINNKKIEIKNLPKNVMLTSDKILLNKKEIKQITSSDKIIGEKEEDKINKNSNLSLNVYEKNNYRQTNYSNYRTRKCINCNCNCYNSDCNCREFFLKNCLSIISFAIDIAIIVVITRIYKWTDKNPLKNINFGNSNIAIDSSTRILENLQKNEFNEESRFFNVSELKEVKQYLRYLDDDCQDFNSKLNESNYNIDKVFDLKFDMVHKTSLGILIIYCISFGTLLLILISALGALCCGNKAYVFLAPLLVLIIIVALFSGITNLILFIILLVNYYKGNSTGDFLDFYEECLDNDKKLYLKDAYNRLDKLNSNFSAFVVLNIFGILLNNISSCCKKKDDN